MTEASIQRGPRTSFSQRLFQHLPVPRTGARPRPFKSVGVIGAGPLGAAITASLLDAGVAVTLKESTSNLLDEGLARVQGYLRDQVTAGLLTPEERDARLDLLSPTCWFVAMAAVDIVIDCSQCRPAERLASIAALDGVMKAGSILAANVSSPDIERLARTTRRPRDVVGVRFSHPAEEMRMMEIAKCEHTAEDVVETCVSLAAAMNRIPVVGSVS